MSQSVRAAFERVGGARLGPAVEAEQALARLQSALFGAARRTPGLERYSLIRRVGAGASGIVYLAYDPRLDRNVAIKLLHPGEQPAERDTRLIREAKAMARCRHPSVVAVHDVGICEVGPDQPSTVFVVMEYVEGPTLRVWLQEPRRWKQVLDVFVAAGRGLAAAHAVGVTHRDFKPANVILGNDGLARVVDFGVAHAPPPMATPTGEGFAERTLDPGAEWTTLQGALVGTPAYMAPEQHAGATVDPRSDQFSFCVALWFGLFGVHPFEAASLGGLHDAKLRETPRRPEDATAPGWLDEILIRGLAPAPKDRWPSMDALLDELSRRASRRRRRWTLAGATAAVVAAAGAGTALGGSTAGDDCDADQALATAWSAARRDEAHAAVRDTGMPYASQTWERVSRDLDDYAARWKASFRSACEDVSSAGDTSEHGHLRIYCLQRAGTRLQATTRALTETESETLARVPYLVAGLVPLETCEDADALRLAALPPPPPGEAERVAELRAELAAVRADIMGGRYEKARRGALAAVERAAELEYGPLHAEADLHLGRALAKTTDYAEARDALERSLRTATLHTDRATMHAAAVILLWIIGAQQYDLETARPYADLALATADTAEQRGDAYHSLGAALHKDGQLEAAESAFVQGFDLRREALGDEHPIVLQSLHGVAMVRASRGNYVEAEAAQRRVVEITERVLGPDHPHLGSALNSLGNALYYQGQYVDAEHAYRQALAIRERALQPEHLDVAQSLRNIANCLHERGLYRDAVTGQRRALAIHRAALGADHPVVAESLSNVARSLFELEEYEDAEAGYRQAIAIFERTVREEHPGMVIARSNLAALLEKQGRVEDALVEYRAALDSARKGHDPNHPRVATLLTNLADALLKVGKPDEALDAAREGWDIYQQIDATAETRGWIAFNLGRAIHAAGTPDERGDPVDLVRTAIAEFERADPIPEARLSKAREWLDRRSE